MIKLHLRTVEKFFSILFLFHISRAFFTGVTTLPSEGDSLAYHIPIAQNLWKGGLFNPADILHYYPSIGEVILSFFMLLRVPLNLFNVVGTIVLFHLSRILGKQTGLHNQMATIFAASLCLLHITMRWIHTQVVDIWLAVFFVWSLVLIQKPKKSDRYFVLLGTSLGLLIGSKSSGLGFGAILLLVYWKNFTKYIDLKKFVLFIIPMSLFGLFWYARNYYLVGNPLYPQAILRFPGAEGWNILQWNVGQIALLHPAKLLNATISEYMGWSLALCLALFFRQRVLFLGLVNLVFFLFLPTTPEYSIIVSSFRYAYPVLIPLMLAVFLLAQKLKKESFVIALSFVNVLFLSYHPYQPKLIFLFVPVVLLYLQVIQMNAHE